MSFCFRQLCLTVSLRVFSSSCHNLMDICVLKIWCHLSGSRSKMYTFGFSSGLFCTVTWRKCQQQHSMDCPLVRMSPAISFLRFLSTQFSREILRWGLQELVFLTGLLLDLLQMWRSTKVYIFQNISMDHVLIKKVCTLLYA